MFGRMVNNVIGFYREINPATLTGAIDIIIIRQRDGTFMSSPFHVRFGKMGVLRSNEKIVDIEVNGESVDIQMKLGEAGEAFFVEEVEDDDSQELPVHLITSPIPVELLNGVPQEQSSLDFMKRGVQELRHKSGVQEALVDSDGNTSSRTSSMEKDARARGSSEEKESRGGASRSSGASESGSKHEDESKQTASEDTFVMDLEDEDTTLEASTDCVDNVCILPTDTQSTVCTTVQEGLATKHSENSLYMSVNNSFEQLPVDQDQLQSNGMVDNETVLTDCAIGNDTVKTDRVRAYSASISTQTDQPSPHGQRSRSTSGSYTTSTPVNDLKTSNSTKSTKESVAPIVEGEDQKTEGKGAKPKRRRKKKSKASNQVKHSDDSNDDTPTAVPPRTPPSTPTPLGADSISIANLELTHEETVELEQLDLEATNNWKVRHLFSDGDYSPIVSPRASRPPSPKSDTEAEMSHRDTTSQTDPTYEGDEDDLSWEWGEVPHPTETVNDSTGAEKKDAEKATGGLLRFMRTTKNIRHKPLEQEGIYLQDLDTKEMDPEIASLYLYKGSSHMRSLSDDPGAGNTNEIESSRSAESSHSQEMSHDNDDCESGRGLSLPHSPAPNVADVADPHHLYTSFPAVEMSLCGGLYDCDIPVERFEQYVITQADFAINAGAILSDQKLVLKINDRYYNWQTAAPILLSYMAFHCPLPQETSDTLIKTHMPKKDKGARRRSGWTSWWRGTGAQTAVGQPPTGTGPSQTEQLNNGTNDSASLTNAKYTQKPSKKTHRRNSSRDVGTDTLSDYSEPLTGPDGSAGPEQADHVTIDMEEAASSGEEKGKSKPHRKTLVLNSEQIESLQLRPGQNEVVFSVTTQYQGTCACTAYMYLWNWDERLIVSDVDGTITRSDVLGHIFPMVGMDWSQAGIASLYNMIERNGYKFMYLSSRSIGQSRVTRDYIRSIRQGDLTLPDGPVLLSPSSLIQAFHNEVIKRKPEVFKTACLRGIASLFPGREPFYAGYGNKVNDAIAYKAVDIPLGRIFIVNHKGNVTLDQLPSYQTSYTSLTDIVDHYFPPIVADSLDELILAGNFPDAEQYSTFTYWREPLPELELPPKKGKKDAEKTKTTDQKSSTTATTTTTS